MFKEIHSHILLPGVDQNLSSLFINELIDLACITEFGRLFHGSATLRGNSFFLKLIFALWVNILRECPLFPIFLRYANVGSFSNFSLYMTNPAYQEVVLWPFSGRFLLLFYVLSYMDTILLRHILGEI